ncbi:UvrD-helicase domain-containing protein [Zhouia sp. PK063]|uniref:UvrD-helicase domain-containing protein n=1 Tax=Zhouia sp. PK063 TaxID=3373602 RepID=UPI0037B635C5
MKTVPFQIYNASAGSGKTFTLVKEYLKIVLGSSKTDHFKNILAITFTNKAVNEMKERVIKSLNEFANEQILEQPTDMFTLITQELKILPAQTHDRSKNILKRILHNYAFFDIVTIDKFNHRIIRTFAHDLALPLNFEVALDTDILLQEAVDNLVYKAGKDKTLTTILVDFALEKTDDDKSWDITLELKKFAKLLLEENHSQHITQLEGLSLDHFINLSKNIKQHIAALKKQLKNEAQAFFELINENSISAASFSRGSIPNFFKKVVEENFNMNFGLQWEQNIADKPLYTKAVPEAEKMAIDGIQQQIATLFHTVKNQIFQLRFLENFYKNVVPLSLLNAINHELNNIKEQDNLMLISEFNAIISNAIANQPAPFIYERLGEKYRHYFIDEFQDTSEMQWLNLQPLIGNAISGENLAGEQGTLMIVGDAKQAIYRWRGGKAEQFINLYNKQNPFPTEEISVKNLPKNFRSFDTVIQFNNNFFKHISPFLSSAAYADLFANKSYQETNAKSGGLVQLTFVEKDDDKDQTYCQNTLENIKQALQDGFDLKDICILTQKKKQGFAIANFLLEQDIPIISSESLLLKNNEKIQFLIALITLAVQPNRLEIQAQLLSLLATFSKEEKHTFITKYLKNTEVLYLDYKFSSPLFLQLPFYNAVEYAIHCFDLADDSDAYLQYFLDEILDFNLKQNGSFSEFLSYWDKKKDRLSIVAPLGVNAVQIMTIHKSKGLEFPVVIFPYAEAKITEEIDPKLWIPVTQENFGMPYALVSKNKDVAELSEGTKFLYDEDQWKVELDKFNVLYVALTRAVERLYIISKKDITKGGENTNSIAGLFINFLKEKQLWDDHKNVFTFGEPAKKTSKSQTENKQEDIPFISDLKLGNTFKIITKSGSLWNTTQQIAIDRGNLYHYLLSEIKYETDVASVIDEAFLNGQIAATDKENVYQDILKVVAHPDLTVYFQPPFEVFNEKEIITKSKQIYRLDRLVISPNKEAIIIDYKTGSPDKKHEEQLETYSAIVLQMGYKVIKKVLVYINDTIDIKSH